MPNKEVGWVISAGIKAMQACCGMFFIAYAHIPMVIYMGVEEKTHIRHWDGIAWRGGDAKNTSER